MKNVKKLILVLLFIFIFSRKNYLLNPVNDSALERMQFVYAKEESVHYSYDSSGRILSAEYPDGTIITYQYDAAGNIESAIRNEKDTETEKTETEKTETEKTETEKTETEKTETEKTETEKTETEKTEAEKADSSYHQKIYSGFNGYRQINRLLLEYGKYDIHNYNSFTQKKPVIKSLKVETNQKNTYLKIQIRKIQQKESYNENGYQIQYSTTVDFKDMKTVTVKKKQKASVTGKRWKVKKGKTYYVRVRAYIQTDTGTCLFSKYSKTLKIQVER